MSGAAARSAPMPSIADSRPGDKGGQFRKGTPVRICPHSPDEALTRRVMVSLKTTFDAHGHRPSLEMWTALEAVSRTLEAMANGVCQPHIHLSSLDPGVGKTTTVIHFLRELLASERHRDVAALVCVKRREQIKAIVSEANLGDDDFAVLTASDELNALGCGSPARARVLFTTHQMVERRCEGRMFCDVSAFHYRGRPRAVRIWDEAILPGQTLTMSRDALGPLLPLRGRLPEVIADVDRLLDTLATFEDGTSFTVPDFPEKHGLDLNDVLGIVGTGTEAQIAAIECLWFLSGKVVTVRRDGAYGNTMLDYRDTLPDDFKPVLALDASGRVRTAYRFWKERRGGIEMLPSATKRYNNLTIQHWNHAGSKSAFRKHGHRLAEAIASTIATKPDDEWLVIHHQDVGGINCERDVRALLPAEGANVHFLHWGAHDATNSYAHIPNVILAGTLFYRTSHYEALGRLAAAHPSAEGAFESDDLNEIMLGEHRNLILQAACRGAVRRCEGDSCPPSSLYLIASARTGIASALPEMFPGATILPWKPLRTALRGKVGEAFAFVLSELEKNPTRFVPFREAMRHIGWRSTKDFKRRIREHDDFVEALCEHGIEEWGSGKWAAGFRLVPASNDGDR